jgi:hypothetical protein
MAKRKVREDFEGLYVHSTGWIARPSKPSAFKAGDTVSAYHHGGSPYHSIKKDSVKETWVGSITAEKYKK